MTVLERFPSYHLAGAKITPTTRDDLNEILKEYVGERRQCVIVHQNMHGLHVRRHEPSFAELEVLPHTYVHIDGMPLVFLCKLAGIEASRAHRVTLVDWIWPMLAQAARESWRVYFVGGTPDVVKTALETIGRRLPDLQLRAHHGFFDDSEGSSENLAVLDDLSSFAPHLVLVGMGMGRQERWILNNLQAIAPASICTVGACMEYLGASVRTPPRWMGSVGLEWLFRLSENPQRFWHRYLVEPWSVLFYLFSQSFRRSQ